MIQIRIRILSAIKFNFDAILSSKIVKYWLDGVGYVIHQRKYVRNLIKFI